MRAGMHGVEVQVHGAYGGDGVSHLGPQRLEVATTRVRLDRFGMLSRNVPKGLFYVLFVNKLETPLSSNHAK